jgi:hypothetical protein
MGTHPLGNCTVPNLAAALPPADQFSQQYVAMPNSMATTHTTNASQHSIVSAKGSEHYVTDDELGYFDSRDDALDAARLKHGGLLKMVRGSGKGKLSKASTFGTRLSYACINEGECPKSNEKRVCDLRIQIAEVQLISKWVVRTPNPLGVRPYLHSDECASVEMSYLLFDGPLPRCVKDELDIMIADKTDKYNLEGFGARAMQRALSKLLETEKYKKVGVDNDMRSRIIARYCRRPLTNDIAFTKNPSLYQRSNDNTSS